VKAVGHPSSLSESRPAEGDRTPRAQCTGIYDLPDGEIHLSARLSADDTTSGVVRSWAGSGTYLGARGTFTSVDRPAEANGDPSDDTIKLLP